MAEEQLRIAALEYHERPAPGKISVAPTKSLTNQRDLSLAYSPGVAYACEAIRNDPLDAARYTARANLVAVVSNDSAVLGLGNIGALAGKPVMEGKGCLFKKFAGIDVFDIEIDESDPDRIVDIVAALEPTFGGINLEDIKAPECFYIERKLRERMKIPVFHDDQHGTAIVSGAAVLNALEIVGKDIGQVKLVCSGAGAAALACLDLLLSLGLEMEHIYVSDIDGVVYKGRKAGMDSNKERFAKDTPARTLDEIITGADIFLGLSAGGVLKPEMVKKMAARPIILAMANPEPEIRPEAAKAARPDCLIGTGRSDYPNQVNNSLCFPFIFRGALDVGATTINEEMKLAAVHALAQIARAEPSEIVALAYGEQTPAFGPEYLIPRAFDPRLIERIAPAVAKAAMESGVATRPITDWNAYRQRLSQLVYQSGATMVPVFESAKRAPKRVVYAEGEDERVLRAALVAVDEGIAHPILIGRTEVIEAQVSKLGLRLKAGRNFELVDPQSDARHESLWREYFALTARDGTTREEARHEMRNRYTAVGAMLVRRGEADAMLCGTYGDYHDHLKPVRCVIGLQPGVKTLAAMQMVILPGHQVFICDTHINVDPTAEQVAEIALLAAEEVRGFGVTPAAALVSHSSFGSSDAPSAIKMREALALIRAQTPDLEIDGEMRADAALSPPVRETLVPESTLKRPANLLIMPSMDAANIAYNLLRIAAGGGIIVGGILLGLARPVHIMTPSSTVRRLVNMTAVAVVDAGARQSSAAAAQAPQAA